MHIFELRIMLWNNLEKKVKMRQWVFLNFITQPYRWKLGHIFSEKETLVDI